jgi:tetratricopeptide (TPR) repeat protein
MRKRIGCVLVITLLIVGVTTLQAKEKPTIAAGPDVRKGDPPPGNAMSLSIPQARVALRETINAQWAGTEKRYTCSGVRDFSIRSSGFTFTRHWTNRYPFGQASENYDSKTAWDFKEEKTDYVQVFGYRFPYVNAGQQFYSVESCTRPDARPEYLKKHEYPSLLWSDQADAQKFVDAFNRLVYAAYHREEEAKNEFVAFSVSAKAWRDNPVKPPLNPEADREWILAENAVKEKNLDSAAEHYEAALEIQPTWPTGWFDLAMIYAEQKNFADAADAMKHYLELTPDAPDAKDARTQMIIWEDKAKQ